MELRDYLRVARRRWKLILGCVLAAVAIAGLATVQTTPQYSSSARLFVSTAPSDSGEAYQGGLFSAERVTSYADLVSGRELSSRVIESLGLEIEPQDLADKITATVVPETVILELTVTDPSPTQAQRLAGGGNACFFSHLNGHYRRRHPRRGRRFAVADRRTDSVRASRHATVAAAICADGAGQVVDMALRFAEASET